VNRGNGIKWVDVSAGATAGDVARRTLKARLEYVQEMAALAAAEYPGDPEPVHRLRVGCRRASAALEAFRPLMRSKPKAMRKWLRRIRRAAGPAREADVLLLRFAGQEADNPCAQSILHLLQQDRDSAQRRIMKMFARMEKKKWQRHVNRSLEICSAAESQPFHAFATTTLNSVQQDFFKLAKQKHPTMDQLHELRIAGKRLRYSIELFHSAFPPSLSSKVYPQVEQLQSRLGKLNDHVSAQALFQSWLANRSLDDSAKQITEQIAQESQAAMEAKEEFFRWWKPKRFAWLPLAE